MNDKLIDEFTNPDSRYRGKPFWAWNGKLNPEELQRQIRIMHRMGLGGFFMHSRVGLATGYLSDEWFDCVRACVDQARELDMEAWLYDEDRWPSGAAGGLVTKNPEYRMRFIVAEPANNPDDIDWEDDELVAVFKARIQETEAYDVEKIEKGNIPPIGHDESLLLFRIAHPELHSWYNGYTYPDTLNPEAVRRFIEVTHEAYRREVGEDFGNVVPGIFTDEPHSGGKFSGGGHVYVKDALTWTEKLPDMFKKRYRYDIIDHLPELFYDVDGEGVTPARHDYYDCVTYMFCEAFAKQIGEWCERNNMLHTGHVLAEETLSSQSRVVGSCMRFYEYMQAPGMDLLTEHNREYDTAKQVSSAARQFGRRWRLTETYGCTGWDFTFAGHKALGDWQAALGINLRCQHLSWYTMEGEAKRDYPASISYQSPWWEEYGTVEDYFGRINAVMSRGVEVRDLLVIHPVESSWLKLREGWESDPEVKRYDNMLRDLRDSLLADNIDFDYGDEDIMSRYAEVINKKDNPLFRIGEAEYKAVLVPPTITMRESTLQLLKEFKEAGGEVVFAGEPAEFVDAEPSDAVAEFAETCKKCPAEGKELAASVDPLCRRVSIADPKENQINPTLHLLREDDENYYLFICNTGHDFRGKEDDIPVAERTEGFDEVYVKLTNDTDGEPIELDPSTGEMYLAEATRAGNGWTIKTDLPAIGSRLFVLPKQKTDLDLQPRPELEVKDIRTLDPPSWNIRLSDHNVVVLDRPEFCIGNGNWQNREEILRIDKMVRNELGIKPRGGAMVQPWARERDENPESIVVTLEYNFDVQTLPDGPLFLGIERPELYKIEINGVMLSPDSECGWWTDRSLRTIPIDPAVLKAGENKVELSCEYDENHPGFEIIYLLGEFGVEVDGTDVTVTEKPDELKVGDWVTQGLPFYSGSVTYEMALEVEREEDERLFVQLPEYRGVAARVFVDGRLAGTAAWPPNEVEITDHVGSGRSCRLGIEILGHRRNSHGPLHWTEHNRRWTGPDSFTTEGEEWTDEYVLTPCGLMQAVEVVVREEIKIK